MPRGWFAHQSPAAFWRIARSPSRAAPHPRDVLVPAAFVPPDLRLDSVERAVLAAVAADPAADGPRLAFADWCDASGDPRGGFVRRHLADPAETPDAAARTAWEDFFRPWGAKDLVFDRGFVEGLSLSGRAFVSLGAGLLGVAPVRAVRLVAVGPFVGELAACPHLGRLVRLDVTGNRLDADARRVLAASPFAPGEIVFGA